MEMPEDMHRELKIAAALEGTTISEIVRRLVESYLKEKTEDNTNE